MLLNWLRGRGVRVKTVVAAASASTREKGVRAKTVTAAVSASTSGEGAGAKTAAAAASVTQHDYAFFTLLALFPQSRSVKLSP